MDDIIVLAVPFTAVKDVAKEIGSYADGKVVINITKPLDKKWSWLSVFRTSDAEENQKLLPNAKVVKAFKTISARKQSTSKLGS